MAASFSYLFVPLVSILAFFSTVLCNKYFCWFSYQNSSNLLELQSFLFRKMFNSEGLEKQTNKQKNCHTDFFTSTVTVGYNGYDFSIASFFYRMLCIVLIIQNYWSFRDKTVSISNICLFLFVLFSSHSILTWSLTN